MPPSIPFGRASRGAPYVALALLASAGSFGCLDQNQSAAAPPVQAPALAPLTRGELDAFVAAVLAAFRASDRQALGGLIDAGSIFGDLAGASLGPLRPEEERRINEMLSYFLLPRNETWSARLLSDEPMGDLWSVRIGLIDPRGRVNQAHVQVGRTAKGVRAVDVWTLTSGGTLVELMRSTVARQHGSDKPQGAEVAQTIARLEALKAQGRCDEVIRIVDGLPPSVGDSFLVHREKIHCAVALPVEERVAVVATYLEKFPDAGDADYQRLTLASLRNEPSAAARELRSLHDKHGPDGYVMAYAALMHMAAGESDEMVRAMQLSLAEEPDLLASRKFAAAIAAASSDEAQVETALREITRVGGGPADLQSALYQGVRSTPAYRRWAQAASAASP